MQQADALASGQMWLALADLPARADLRLVQVRVHGHADWVMGGLLASHVLLPMLDADDTLLCVDPQARALSRRPGGVGVPQPTHRTALRPSMLGTQHLIAASCRRKTPQASTCQTRA